MMYQIPTGIQNVPASGKVDGRIFIVHHFIDVEGHKLFKIYFSIVVNIYLKLKKDLKTLYYNGNV